MVCHIYLSKSEWKLLNISISDNEENDHFILAGRGGVGKIWGIGIFWDQNGFFSDLDGGGGFHDSLVNIFHKCNKKAVFMKNI